MLRVSLALARYANDERSCFQYAWIKHRIVSFAELSECLGRYGINERQVQQMRPVLQTQNLVHCVVLNIWDEAWVITNYFWGLHGADIKETLQSMILDFLDADEPSVISDAAANPIFERTLMQHFQGGDQTQSWLWWHTMSKLKSPLNLLCFCIQQNYSDCVNLLLSEHTIETAKKPWLVFAEPMLPVDKYQNTAFHAAAWCGSTGSLEHLVQHAIKHSLPIQTLLDSKKKTCLTLARERGHHRCVQILAPLFGYKPERIGGFDGERNEQDAVLFVDFVDDAASQDAASQDAASQDAPPEPVQLHNIAMAFPEEFLAWLTFDDPTWLVRDNVASRTYADDDVWITLREGSEIVRVETLMRDCVWM